MLDSNGDVNWEFILEKYQLDIEQLKLYSNKISDEGWKTLVKYQKNLDEEFIRQNLNRFISERKYLTKMLKHIDDEVLRNNQLSESFFINNYELLDKKSWKIISKEQDISLEFIVKNKDYIDFNSISKNSFLINDYGKENIKNHFTKDKIVEFYKLQIERNNKKVQNNTYLDEELKNINIQNVVENADVLNTNIDIESPVNNNDYKNNINISSDNKAKPIYKPEINDKEDLDELEDFSHNALDGMNEMFQIVKEAKEKSTNNDNELSEYTTKTSLEEVSLFADSCLKDYQDMYDYMMKVQNGEKVNFEEVTQSYKRGIKNITKLTNMVKQLKKDNELLRERNEKFKHFKEQDTELNNLETQLENKEKESQGYEVEALDKTEQLMEKENELEDLNRQLEEEFKMSDGLIESNSLSIDEKDSLLRDPESMFDEEINEDELQNHLNMKEELLKKELEDLSKEEDIVVDNKPTVYSFNKTGYKDVENTSDVNEVIEKILSVENRYQLEYVERGLKTQEQVDGYLEDLRKTTNVPSLLGKVECSRIVEVRQNGELIKPIVEVEDEDIIDISDEDITYHPKPLNVEYKGQPTILLGRLEGLKNDVEDYDKEVSKFSKSYGVIAIPNEDNTSKRKNK